MQKRAQSVNRKKLLSLGCATVKPRDPQSHSSRQETYTNQASPSTNISETDTTTQSTCTRHLHGHIQENIPQQNNPQTTHLRTPLHSIHNTTFRGARSAGWARHGEQPPDYCKIREKSMWHQRRNREVEIHHEKTHRSRPTPNSPVFAAHTQTKDNQDISTNHRSQHFVCLVVYMFSWGFMALATLLRSYNL